MRPVLIAHRGDSAYAPENTERAFRQAIEKEADWIETDLQLTHDGHVVAFHDDELRRLTGVAGDVEHCNLHDLKDLYVQAGRWRPGADTTVPTLARVLEVASALPLYLEMKSNGHGRADQRNRRLLDACLSGVPEGSAHALASFDLDLVRGAIEAGRRAILIASDFASLAELSRDELRSLFAVSVRHDQIDVGLAAHLTDCEVPLWAWTVDERDDVRRMLGLDVSGICTNDVARVGPWLKERAG